MPGSTLVWCSRSASLPSTRYRRCPAHPPHPQSGCAPSGPSCRATSASRPSFLPACLPAASFRCLRKLNGLLGRCDHHLPPPVSAARAVSLSLYCCESRTTQYCTAHELLAFKIARACHCSSHASLASADMPWPARVLPLSCAPVPADTQGHISKLQSPAPIEWSFRVTQRSGSSRDERPQLCRHTVQSAPALNHRAGPAGLQIVGRWTSRWVGLVKLRTNPDDHRLTATRFQTLSLSHTPIVRCTRCGLALAAHRRAIAPKI